MKLSPSFSFEQDEQVRMGVLGHGCLDLRNIVFQYDDVSGRPIAAKFLDFSTLTVASPVLDITYFLHSSVVPELASHHHSLLLQIYHRSHLEAVKSFGMHGYEIELEDLVVEYQKKQESRATIFLCTPLFICSTSCPELCPMFPDGFFFLPGHIT